MQHEQVTIEGGIEVALAIAYHNLCRYHATLRCTPCMAQGITKTIWSIEDLLTASLINSLGHDLLVTALSAML